MQHVRAPRDGHAGTPVPFAHVAVVTAGSAGRDRRDTHARCAQSRRGKAPSRGTLGTRVPAAGSSLAVRPPAAGRSSR